MNNGYSGVQETNKNKGHTSAHRRIKLLCVSTAAALSAANLYHIDLLSLDVEGHEHLVLEGIDWSAVRINVIVIETLNSRSKAVLRDQGFHAVRVPNTKEERKKHGALIRDQVFIHTSVVWGRPT